MELFATMAYDKKQLIVVPKLFILDFCRRPEYASAFNFPQAKTFPELSKFSITRDSMIKKVFHKQKFYVSTILKILYQLISKFFNCLIPGGRTRSYVLRQTKSF